MPRAAGLRTASLAHAWSQQQGPSEEDVLQEQFARVAATFERQLRLPLMNLDDAWETYEEWYLLFNPAQNWR
jgi:hypothetical protein